MKHAKNNPLNYFQDKNLNTRLTFKRIKEITMGKVASGIMRQSRAARLIDFRILITYLLAFHTR